MYYIHVCRHVRMYECTYARMLHACLCGKLLDGWEFWCHCCEDHRGAFAYALYILVSSYINLLEVPMSKFKNLWIGSTAGCLGSEVHRILIKSAESSCQSSVAINSQGFHCCHYAVEHLMLLTRWAKCRAHVSAGSTAHGRRRRSSTRGCQQRREPCHRKKAPTLNKAAISAQNQRAPLSLSLALFIKWHLSFECSPCPNEMPYSGPKRSMQCLEPNWSSHWTISAQLLNQLNLTLNPACGCSTPVDPLLLQSKADQTTALVQRRRTSPSAAARRCPGLNQQIMKVHWVSHWPSIWIPLNTYAWPLHHLNTNCLCLCCMSVTWLGSKLLKIDQNFMHDFMEFLQK